MSLASGGGSVRPPFCGVGNTFRGAKGDSRALGSYDHLTDLANWKALMGQDLRLESKMARRVRSFGHLTCSGYLMRGEV